jgi:hypothetical protein
MTSERFCSNCGKTLSKKPIQPRKSRNLIVIAGAAFGVAILIAAIAWAVNKNNQNAVNRAHDIAQIEGIVFEFDCSCGQCDKTLKNCDCPTAKETHRYLSKAVGKEKYSRKEIIDMVNQRYGYLRGKIEEKGMG